MKTLQQKIEVMEAAKNGALIELTHLHQNDWVLVIKPSEEIIWDWSTFDYRIAPPKKLLPLGPEDFPPGTVIREKTQPNLWRQVNCVSYDSFWAYPWKASQPFHSDSLMDEFERSLDGGKTWLPCYREE